MLLQFGQLLLKTLSDISSKHDIGRPLDCPHCIVSFLHCRLDCPASSTNHHHISPSCQRHRWSEQLPPCPQEPFTFLNSLKVKVLIVVVRDPIDRVIRPLLGRVFFPWEVPMSHDNTNCNLR